MGKSSKRPPKGLTDGLGLSSPLAHYRHTIHPQHTRPVTANPITKPLSERLERQTSLIRKE